MIRKHKRFSWPRKLYDKDRIQAENLLVERYGLKNKREIWKAEAKVRYFRMRAKILITASQDEQKAFFAKLNAIGLKAQSISDVLALNMEDILKRRLATVLVDKGLATTPRGARQMIVHKRVLVDKETVSSPSYLVSMSDERAISVKLNKPSTIKTEVAP